MPRILSLKSARALRADVARRGRARLAGSSRRKGKHLHRLALAEGTLVVLRFEQDAAARGTPDGVQVTVSGRIFVGTIPERYGIIERTGDPYLLDVVVGG